MDNIKKFEDFLDRMQGLLDNAKKQGHIIVRVEDLENTFPELKESEDERMRKELICFLETEIPQCNARDKYIAWLEKQGEQKPAWKPSDEQMNTLEHYMHTLICTKYKEILFGLYEDLKKLREE